jgi:hypothetical protein
MQIRRALAPTLVACLATVAAAQSGGVVLLEPLAGRQVFPVTNWWNQDVSSAPVDSGSAAFINWISGRATNPTAVRRLHPDFGPPPYGIPYIVLPGNQPLVPLTFDYADESDAGAPGAPAGYPIPPAAITQSNYVEGGLPGGGPDGDRHVLMIDRDRWLLFETFATQWNAGSGRWAAGSGAVFDLSTNARRPDTWTSADAAGLAIFPGLVRYDEAFGAGEIRHAFRFTTRGTNGYVWPASHRAGSAAGAPPLGARLRLKATKNLSGYSPSVQRIFRAMQVYGLILADNGSDMYISGTMDARWNNDDLNPAFSSLNADDFEVIQLGWGRTPAPTTPTGLRIVPQ